MLRRVLHVLKWTGIVLVVAIVVLAIYVAFNWDRNWEVAAPDLHATTDPAMIARGEYLVFGPAHCVECHTSSLAEYEHYVATGERPALSGGFPFPIGPLGTLYSRNITPDPRSGIGRYSDPQVARMLRQGVRPDGKASIPDLMPYGDMSDDDVVAVLSFLRAQPPVARDVPRNEWTTLGKVMRTFVSAARPRMDVNPPKTAPPPGVSAARGEYLARSVSNCSGCHSPYNMLTGALTGPRFSGGDPAMEPVPRAGVDTSLWFKPPNITPLPGSALSKFPDRATFVARFKVGGRKYAGSPMPWECLAKMTEDDAGSLYEFLKTVPPSGLPAPTEPTVKQ